MGLASYLFKNEGRQRLLEKLVFAGEDYTVTELATMVGLPYATLHAELEGLRKNGLLQERVEGRKRYVRAVLSKELKSALAPLLGLRESGKSERAMHGLQSSHELSANEVKASLQEYGAPLVLEDATHSNKLPAEEVFARGTLLSKQDASVARVLPVVLAKNWQTLDKDLLLLFARRFKVKREVGFFLELTSKLSENRKMKREAERYRDSRVKQPSDFFSADRTSQASRELAERNTPSLARQWHFRMNMSLETFESTFRRFVHSGPKP